MKRIFCVITLAMLVLLSACGGTDNALSSGTTAATTTATDDDTGHFDSTTADDATAAAPNGAGTSTAAPGGTGTTARADATAKAAATTQKTDPPATTAKPAAAMSASSAGISGGVIADKYGLHKAQQDGTVPTLSLPILIRDAPEGTVCYALTMLDKSAGDWIHWLATDFTAAELAENASKNPPAGMVQGMNSWDKTGFGGPTPPSGNHKYEITVYALKAKLGLSTGYTLDQFKTAVKNQSLAQATFTGTYKS